MHNMKRKHIKIMVEYVDDAENVSQRGCYIIPIEKLSSLKYPVEYIDQAYKGLMLDLCKKNSDFKALLGGDSK